MLIKLILWHWKMVIKETFELASDKVCYDNGGWHICHKDQSLASLPVPVFATSRPVAVGQSERYFQRWNRVGTHLRNNPKHRDQASSLLTTPLCEQQKWGLDRTELAFFVSKEGTRIWNLFFLCDQLAVVVDRPSQSHKIRIKLHLLVHTLGPSLFCIIFQSKPFNLT